MAAAKQSLDCLPRSEQVRLHGVGGDDVREADGEGIGGVRSGGFLQMQEGTHHEGNLLLQRAASPHGGEFHAGRGVLGDGQAVLGGGKNRRRAGGAHGDGRLVGLNVDDSLDGEGVGLPTLDEGVDVLVDGEQAGALAAVLRQVERAVLQRPRLAIVPLQHGIARVADSRVNSDDAHGGEQGTMLKAAAPEARGSFNL